MAAPKLPLLDRVAIIPKLIALVLVAALVAVFAWTMRPSPPTRELTAYFPQTVALYSGSDVRILGVPVGKVDSVKPQGERVKVTMHYKAKYDVPANVKAVIIAPALVGDRFVQLAPVYESGPTLPDGAVLGVKRTATPVELDTIYQSLDDLSVALGPRGANKRGALDNLLKSAAANLDGNGAKIHQTLGDVGKLTDTLSDNKQELFGTVRQLDRFVGMLARNRKTIRAFNQHLSQVAHVLSGERKDLAAALRNLSTALTAVSDFVHDNKGELKHNIHGLRQVTDILVDERDALAKVLEVAPLALGNLGHAYNPQTGTLDQRMNIGENVNQIRTNPGLVLCSIVHQAGNPANSCQVIKKLLKALPKLPGLNRGEPFSHQQVGPVEVEHIDKTLAGLVEGDK
ncbi:MAG: MCE family protein [Nocardioidaceae bacterium]